MAVNLGKANAVHTAEYGNNSFGFTAKGAAVTVLGSGPTRGGKWIESDQSVNGNQGQFIIRGDADAFEGSNPTNVRQYESYRFAYYVGGSPTSQMLMADIRVGSQIRLYLNTSRRLVVEYKGVEYEASDAGILAATTEVYIALFWAFSLGTDNRFGHVVLMVNGSVVLSQVVENSAPTATALTGVRLGENLAGGVNRGVVQRFGAITSLYEDGDSPYGELWVTRLTPNANGTISDVSWTGTGVAAPDDDYQHWDDAAPSTTDADYNTFTGSTLGTSVSALPTLSAGDLPVFVVGRCWHRVSGTVKNQLVTWIYYDGTNTSQIGLVVPSTAFIEAVASSSSCLMMNNDPAGADWTLTALGNLQVGYRGFSFGTQTADVGLVSVDVAYQPSGQADYAALPMPFSRREG